MIHYINGKPHQNIRLHKTQPHAVQSYRNKKTNKTIKEILTATAAITLSITLVYLYLVVTA